MCNCTVFILYDCKLFVYLALATVYCLLVVIVKYLEFTSWWGPQKVFSINTIITKVNMQSAYANLRVKLYKLSNSQKKAETFLYSAILFLLSFPKTDSLSSTYSYTTTGCFRQTAKHVPRVLKEFSISG